MRDTSEILEEAIPSVDNDQISTIFRQFASETAPGDRVGYGSTKHILGTTVATLRPKCTVNVKVVTFICV